MIQKKRNLNRGHVSMNRGKLTRYPCLAATDWRNICEVIILITSLYGHGDCGPTRVDLERKRSTLGVGNWSRLDVSANCSLNAPVTRSGALRSAKRNRGNRERGIPLQILIAFLMENNLIRSPRFWFGEKSRWLNENGKFSFHFWIGIYLKKKIFWDWKVSVRNCKFMKIIRKIFVETRFLEFIVFEKWNKY